MSLNTKFGHWRASDAVLDLKKKECRRGTVFLINNSYTIGDLGLLMSPAGFGFGLEENGPNHGLSCNGEPITLSSASGL